MENSPSTEYLKAGQGFKVFCWIIALLSLWLRTGFPVHASPIDEFDDELFVKLARELNLGHWLGAFDNRTLIKGAFYPLFIAASFDLGLPLKIAEQIVYLASAGFVATTIRSRRGGPTIFAGFVFAALAFNPALWTDMLSHVLRDGLYVGLSLGLVGCIVSASFGTPTSVLGNRAKSRLMLRAGLLAGIMGGCFWLTREEGLWLAPALTSIAAFAVFDLWRRARADALAAPVRVLLARLAAPWMLASTAALIIVGAIATINFFQYGAFETTETQSLAFREAYGALARIQTNKWERYVVFPNDARARAYAASPAARELEPFLDGQIGSFWRQIGCSETGQHDCHEIFAGWFLFALRDAVAAAGYYKTAATAASFYTRLADEIDSACLRGRLPCLPPRATLAPPFRPTYVLDALRVCPVVLDILLHPGGGDTLGVTPSQGTPEMIDRFADFVGSVALPDDGSETIRGWVAGAKAPDLIERSPNGVATREQPAVYLAPDLSPSFPGSQVERFTLQTDCNDCIVGATVLNGSEMRIPIRILTRGVLVRSEGIELYVEDLTAAVHSASAARRRVIRKLAGFIVAAYGAALTPICALACVGLVARLFQKGLQSPSLPALAMASGIAVATRVVLLSYMQVTAFPTVNDHYASPASPFLILFGLVGCWLGLSTMGIGSESEMET